MINKRQLDSLIQDAIYERHIDCGRPYEEYCQTPFYQEHVCQYVRECCMPYCLAKYLYADCYYDDIETVQANVDYINQTMPTIQFYDTWQDITLDMVLKELTELKNEVEKKLKEEVVIHNDLDDLLRESDSIDESDNEFNELFGDSDSIDEND